MEHFCQVSNIDYRGWHTGLQLKESKGYYFEQYHIITGHLVIPQRFHNFGECLQCTCMYTDLNTYYASQFIAD